ncbi:MAG TPA: hypothetical protein VFQ31_08095 [Methyloceanibacter sp.]|nr:hypothetical protein [Methyloceanibacter sp.]
MGYRLFSSLTREALPLAALVVTAVLIAPAGAADPKAAGSPFDALSGEWKGGGTVTPTKGEPLKVACKATYKVTGGTLAQHLRCAGEDYSINATTKLTNKGGKVKGSWNEATYDANGGVTGTAKDKTIHARITGDKFSGRMSINVSGTGHEINIMQLNEDTNTYRQAASVSLHR